MLGHDKWRKEGALQSQAGVHRVLALGSQCKLARGLADDNSSCNFRRFMGLHDSVAIKVGGA